MAREYYVYIATNRYNTVLYTGVTNDIYRRIYEHKNKLIKGFTSKYNISRLVFVESFSTAIEAIESEKKIKGWTRKKKINLIRNQNPKFKDLLVSN